MSGVDARDRTAAGQRPVLGNGRTESEGFSTTLSGNPPPHADDTH